MNSATSAIVLRPGVWNSSGARSPSGSATAGATGTDAAFSRFAEYRHDLQIATKSSPASDATMNSCDWLPPMAPECASTTVYSSPQRSKMRQYAS